MENRMRDSEKEGKERGRDEGGRNKRRKEEKYLYLYNFEICNNSLNIPSPIS